MRHLLVPANGLRAVSRSLVWAAAVLGVTALQAQQTATLTGVVTDSTAAVVPGAEIRLLNPETGETYSAASNEAGAYNIPLIKPGAYQLEAESAGFKKYVRSGIILDTGSAVRADIALELGEVTEVVTVEADIPLLRTESSSVGNVVKNETIANMPLLGRRAAQLVRLSGFVVQAGDGSQFQIAGGRSNNAMWTLDGGSAQNVMLGVATLTFDPPIEALEEMNVEVSNYKAEMGRTGGGFIQMTTKSGTNNFHGAVYEFLRNDALDSRQFFADDKQKLRRNQFGWAFGGPIKRDRTFFFASQEWIRQRTSNPVLQNLPNPAETRGDLSGLSATIRDPFTRQVLPNKIVPASQMDPVGVAVAEFWPDPNLPNRPSRNQNYLGLSSTSTDSQAVTLRLDHNVNDRHRLYGRYVHNLADNANDRGIWPGPPVNAGENDVRNTYFNWSITGVSNVTSRMVTENRFTWNHRKFHPITPTKGMGLSEQIGFRGGDPEFFPGFTFAGGIAGIGRTGQHERRQFPIRDVHYMNNWTFIAGNHAWKWGGEFRASQNDDEFLPTAGGVANFNNNAAGDSIAALLYGYAFSGARQQTLLIRSRSNTMGLFIQDDWKVNPKLTLNLGVRYDLDTPRWEEIDNRQSSFDADAINPVCNCPGIVTWSGRTARGGSKYAHNFAKANFSPRFGFAYRATDNWVIRGGSSLVYIGQYDQATPTVVNAGFSVQGNFAALRPTDAAFLLSDGLPAIQEPTEEDLVPGFGAVPIGTGTVFAPDFFQPEGRPMPYLINYNFNVQRLLPGNMLFEVGYLSTLGRKLTIPGSMTVNQIHPSLIGEFAKGTPSQVLRPFPQYSNVTMQAPTVGSSEYHGVNFKLEKRYSDGLQFSMNYTFARAIDNVEGRNELAGEDGNAPFANQYDIRQAWSLGGSHIKHRFITAVVWDVPWGRGRAHSFSNPVANQILGGWTLGTIMEFRTGAPFSAFWGNASQIYPTAARVRVDTVSPYAENQNWRENVRGEAFFDPSAFVRPAALTFGTLGRNAFIGPGAVRADLSVIKSIYMPFEGHSLELRGEVINFPNTANFANPAQNLQANNFGTVNGLVAGASGRIFQIGLRYGF